MSQLRKSILVVDDNKGVRNLMAELLEREGHRVLTAADARAAMDIAFGSRLDLLVTDVGLPGMSGIDLAAQVGSGYASMPVLFVSGSRATELGAAARDLDLLEKPFTPDAFLDAVRRALENRRVR